jgi:hypothetical protein
VRYFLSRRHPAVHSILLVESGSREILDRAVGHLRHSWGPDVRIDLVTCFSGFPGSLDPKTSRLYNVADFRGRAGRRQLYRQLAAGRYDLAGIICSGEPLMTKWKWALALRLPAKIFIINENADYFSVDRGHLRNLRWLVAVRGGLTGAGAVRTLAGFLVFPFTFLYLLLYATTVHTRRALRRG